LANSGSSWRFSAIAKQPKPRCLTSTSNTLPLVAGRSQACAVYVGVRALYNTMKMIRESSLETECDMRGTLVTDLRHFLTDDGAIASMPSPAIRLAEFLAKVVVDATSPESGHDLTAVRCRRRPGRKPCLGEIVTVLDSQSTIVWWCPICDDNGLISNWEGTLWDRTNDFQLH